MGARIHRLKWLTGVLAFSMAIALVGIPISYSLHTHALEPDTCVDAHGHSHGASQEPPDEDEACDLCVFYAYYAPREATALFVFSFGTWPMLWPIHVGKKRAGQPQTAFVLHDANRGPPVAKRIS